MAKALSADEFQNHYRTCHTLLGKKKAWNVQSRCNLEVNTNHSVTFSTLEQGVTNRSLYLSYAPYQLPSDTSVKP